MSRLDHPIITSWLDTDFYKFTMGLFVWKEFRDVQVRYALKLRNKDMKLDHIFNRFGGTLSRLHEEIASASKIGFNKTDLHYLRGTNEYGERMFPESYLEFLGSIKKLPDVYIEPVEQDLEDYELKVEVEGPWPVAIFWETLILSIVNELSYEFRLRDLTRIERAAIEATGLIRLKDKIDILRKHPDITFCDFGARRRFSRTWQYRVDEFLAEAFAGTGQFLGTSCVKSAELHGLQPMGTNAHELQMVCSALARDDEELRASHNRVLRLWWDLFGHGLSIALPDTFGSDFFFRDFTAEQARSWKGVRQDSGDPAAFGEKLIAFYDRCGVDAKEKLLVFSDGLELPRILSLAAQFHGRIRSTFGWGTNLTNDFGLPALSLVMKAVSANGRPTVKLSDNPAKASGPEDEIMRYMRVFEYDRAAHTTEICTY